MLKNIQKIKITSVGVILLVAIGIFYYLQYSTTNDTPISQNNPDPKSQERLDSYIKTVAEIESEYNFTPLAPSYLPANVDISLTLKNRPYTPLAVLTHNRDYINTTKEKRIGGAYGYLVGGNPFISGIQYDYYCPYSRYIKSTDGGGYTDKGEEHFYVISGSKYMQSVTMDILINDLFGVNAVNISQVNFTMREQDKYIGTRRAINADGWKGYYVLSPVSSLGDPIDLKNARSIRIIAINQQDYVEIFLPTECVKDSKSLKSEVLKILKGLKR